MVWIIIAVIVLVIFLSRSKTPRSEAISNWNHMFDGLKFSNEELYTAIEKSLQERQVPNIKVSRVTFKTGGIFSESRLYLQIIRKDQIFHVGAGPFGTGFFISWWLRQRLSKTQELLMKIPGIGPKIVEAMQNKPYYHWDTSNMFKQTVHNCILEVLDGITSAKGIRGLSEFDRRPNDQT